MGLIDKRRSFRQSCRQRMNFLAIIIENHGAAEFHGRLNDQPDDILPSLQQTMHSERGVKDVQSAMNVFDLRRRWTLTLGHFSARRRDLCSDDVKRFRRTGWHIRASFFSSLA